jgi:hypothetical protein
VFHVSQLKKLVGNDVTISSSLPGELSALQILDEVLQHRVISHSVVQVLVQWSSSPPSLVTWEDYEALKQKFPSAHAWGQAAYYGGGNVSVGDQCNTPSATVVATVTL